MPAREPHRPLVSIGLPVYNEESSLREALDSILAQDYAPLEIVISDNASTDGTRDICVEYASRNERITYHRSESNIGAGGNFSRAFQLSRGEYFMWASGHDTRDPSLVSKCVRVLEQEPDVVICYPRTLFTEYGDGTTVVMEDKLETRKLSTSDRLRTIIREAEACNAVYGVIRSSALRRTRLVRKCLGADHVLLAELSVQGGFHQLDEPLFFRHDNRPPEGSQEKVLRHLEELGGPDARTPGRPRWVMGWEHLLGVWHVASPLPSKVNLTVRAAGWFWGRWRDYLMEERTVRREPTTRPT